VAEPGRQSNRSTLLLGHARDEIVAATGCTPEAAENTIRNGLEEQRLGFTHGHLEGQLPPGVTDVAAHLFSRKAADEKLEYDWANSSVTRSGSDYSYTIRNIRVERIELMTWCREANLLLPEELLAPSFTLSSPEFAISVGALDFATPVLTVRPGPGQAVPPETAANPTESVVRPAVSSNQEPWPHGIEPSNPETWPGFLGRLVELMKAHPKRTDGESDSAYLERLAKKQDLVKPKTLKNLMPLARRLRDIPRDMPQK
jgi:hypothetical protein